MTKKHPTTLQHGQKAGTRSFPIVGIGASAGGLEPLKAFFEKLPDESDMAFVVIMHLSPDRESRLANILEGSTQMRVLTVEERTQVEPNHVYVIRPNQMFELEEGHIVLLEEELDRPVRATIDRFFRSLSQEWKSQAVAVVLSGSGSDGTLGLRAVKEAGGLTLVQSPKEAEFPSMPEHAIASGQADVVLPAGQLARKLMAVREATTPGNLPKDGEVQVPDETGVQQILELVREATGHDFSGYKRSTMFRCITRRMRIHHKESLSDYRQLLCEDVKEAGRLYRDLLISVTSFFRDPPLYEELAQNIIPDLYEGKTSEDEVRIWVPGCATGEEAYSLAILFAEERARRKAAPKIQIFATDVNREAIGEARQGTYPRAIAADVSAHRIERFFKETGDQYQVSKEIRDMVLFARHDLLKDPPFLDLDLVSCRNVLIYLDREHQESVIRLFHFALRSGGYLVLGATESANRTDDSFARISDHRRIYQRRPGPSHVHAWPKRGKGVDKGVRFQVPWEQNPEFAATFRQQALRRYAPTCLLVGSDYHILHVINGESPLLHYPEGSSPHSVLEVVPTELRPAVRTALHGFFQRGDLRSKTMRIERFGQEYQVQLRVGSVDFDDGFAEVVLEVMEEGAEESAVLSPAEHVEAPNETIRQLDEELQEMKSRLQATVEEYETSTEELRAANEELLAMNEELESTAQELGTREEELQATNEELMAVNDALERKVEEAEQACNDLDNFIAATDIGLLFLDRELRIRRFTAPMEEIFSLVPNDVGRSITDITHRLKHDRWLDDARKVLDHRDVLEHEVVTADDEWYLVHIRPYETESGKVDGLVMSFVDITSRKRAEFELAQVNEALEERVRERTRALEATNEELRERIAERNRLEQEVLEVAEQERWRIGETLHEDVGQRLTGAEMLLSVHRQNLRDEQSPYAREVGDVLEIIKDADRRITELARGIIPLELGENGLLVALENLAAEMEYLYDIECTVSLEELVPEDELSWTTHLYRTAQEAIQNAALHGKASRVDVRLVREGEDMVFTVTDNGDGLAKTLAEMDKKGMQIRLMKYRCHVLNGRFSMDASPEGGGQVECRFPASK